MYACNGVLFNHESPPCGETFVTRNITRGMSRIEAVLEDCFYLENIDLKRDWVHVPDHVEMQWRILLQYSTDDFVRAIGHQEIIRRFIELSAEKTGCCGFYLEGTILDEIVYYEGTGDVCVRIGPFHFYPAEVETLSGNSTIAFQKLGWMTTTTLEELFAEIVTEELQESSKEALLCREVSKVRRTRG